MPDDRTAIIDKVIEQFQNGLLTGERRVAAEMIRAYAGSWKAIRRNLDKLEKDIPRVKSGQISEQNWFYQNRRLLDLKPLIENELKKFGDLAVDKISKQQLQAIEMSAEFARDLVVLEMGGLHDIPDRLRIHNLNVKQIAAMIGINQPGSPLSTLFNSVMVGGGEAAFDILSEAVTFGYNPRKVATMLKDSLGMTLTRSLTISRTEMMRAARVAAQEIYKGSEVVNAWRWNANPDGLTCPTCMIMHGTEHPIEERMNSHPRCRCVPVPITISWEELGERFGLDLSSADEISADFEEVAKKYGLSLKQANKFQFSQTKGTDYLSSLPVEKQIEILGVGRWQSWHDGNVTLEDMIRETWSPVWGKGYAMKAVSSLPGGDHE